MLRQISAIAVAGIMFAAGMAAGAPQQSAPQTIYGVAVVDGEPVFVPLDAQPSATPTFFTPTPIVYPSATPHGATPTQVTAQPTHTPQGYPFWSAVNGGDGRRFEVMTATLRIRQEPHTSATIMGYYTQGQMPLIRCLFNVSASEVWGSEQTCGSPGSWWSAVRIGSITYMEIVD